MEWQALALRIGQPGIVARERYGPIARHFGAFGNGPTLPLTKPCSWA
jgi:hypothetical protein